MFIREVKTENGWVRGIQAADPRITAYKGIPFAAPPVGDNRWRAPQPCMNWTGTLDCFDFKPISIQNVPKIDEKNVYTREWSVDPDLAMSEDCLYLNVWVPAAPGLKNLPVFVWYFGGGLQVGHTSEMEFDGERIARRGIIMVSINYRLNVFGFLCHPEITKENPDAPANFGHLDQQAGTRWVKRNIAAFGGDPENITIGGQSAGGASVVVQLTSPQNEGLFQRSIIQSGLFAYPYPSQMHFGNTPSLEEGEKQGVNFFKALGVTTLEEARAVDAITLLRKVKEQKTFWSTVIDRVFCVDNPNDRLIRNKRVGGAVLCGRTSSEFFIGPNVDDVPSLIDMAKAYFGKEADDFLRIVRAESADIDKIKKNATISGLDFSIRAITKESQVSGCKDATYYYVFDAEIPGWDNMSTFHSVDLWFFFETLAKCWRPFVGKHYDLARQMCTYWAHFIKTGNPNGADADGQPLPYWDELTSDSNACMVFGDTPHMTYEAPSELMRLLIRNFIRREHQKNK